MIKTAQSFAVALAFVAGFSALGAGAAQASEASDAIAVCRKAATERVEGVSDEGLRVDRINDAGRVTKVWLIARDANGQAHKVYCAAGRDGAVRTFTATKAE